MVRTVVKAETPERASARDNLLALTRQVKERRKDMTLHYVNGTTAQAEITKEGRKYIYFTAGSFRSKYRLVKETGEIEIGPYWYKEPKMYVTTGE